MSSQPAEQTEHTKGFAYRPALDGLRALSVAAVFAHHLEYASFRGGFLGVDVFFVLSGYLITSLLLAEWTAREGIALRAFWARRARRLLPAVFLLLGVIAAYAYLAAPADQLDRIRGEGLATLLYVQNWWLILEGQSYFDLYATPSPLRHAWSLAIEEQFYLFWPLIVYGALRFGRGSRLALLAISVLGALASCIWMWLRFDPVDPSAAYFGTGARAQTLLVGATLALLLEKRGALAERHRRPIQLLGAAAFLACLACVVLADAKAPALYHGGWLLFSLGVAAVIAAAVQPDGGVLTRILSLGPLRALGTISYGVYLWHWPAIVLLTRTRLGIEGYPLAAVQVGATLLISWASYVLLERPIRHGALRDRVSVSHAVAAGAVVMMLVTVSTVGGVGPSDVYQTPGEAMAPEPAPPVPGAAAPVFTIGVVGDSVAQSLEKGLRKVVEPLGMRVINATIPGCGVAVRVAVDRDGVPFEWSKNCNQPRSRGLRRLYDLRPELVIWLSSWDFADQLVQGRHVRFDSAEGERILLEYMDRIIDRFTRMGTTVALLNLAERTGSDRGPAHLDPDGFVRRYNELLRMYAAEHPESVVLVDLFALMCPSGLPCPEQVEGIRPRPDGGHFSEEGAIWATRRALLPLIEELR